MEGVTRRLITGSDLEKELTDLRGDPDLMLLPEGDEMLDIIEAASKVASQKAMSKDDWVIDDRSEKPAALQASVNAVYTIWEKSASADSDKW